MAVGSITKSSPLTFNLVSSKDDDKKDPKKGTQDFGPSGVAAYGSGKAVSSTETHVKELQNDSATFDVSPSPKIMMKIGASTTRGTELITLM